MFEEKHKNPSLTVEVRNRSAATGISKFWIIAIIIIAFTVILVILGLYINAERKLNKVEQTLEQTQNNPAAKTREANKNLVEQVGQLIILPQDEEPTIATVTDLEKLKSQPFFANAQLGDKVLIYTRAKKAILFRPEKNQIVELAPLTDNNPISTSPQTTPQPTSQPAQ